MSKLKRETDSSLEGTVIKLPADPSRLYMQTEDGEHYLLHQFTDVPNKKLEPGMPIKGIIFRYSNGGGYVQPGTVVVLKPKTKAEPPTLDEIPF